MAKKNTSGNSSQKSGKTNLSESKLPKFKNPPPPPPPKKKD